MWNESPQFDIDLDDVTYADDTPTFSQRQGSAYSVEDLNTFSCELSPSTNSHATSSSRGLKKKTLMNTLARHQFEDVSASIKSVVDMLGTGNKIAEISTKELIGAIQIGNSIQEHQRERIYDPNEIYAEQKRLDLPDTLLDCQKGHACGL
ncbi:unnamed protein product [Linum trigynum]|uniref:Uncharacterized protein n=1 Tax=Linum trigynum TaxID=586398 RepID=A0AAV2CX43_9ROSI